MCLKKTEDLDEMINIAIRTASLCLNYFFEFQRELKEFEDSIGIDEINEFARKSFMKKKKLSIL